jgi:hypothetical protein
MASIELLIHTYFPFKLVDEKFTPLVEGFYYSLFEEDVHKRNIKRENSLTDQ